MAKKTLKKAKVVKQSAEMPIEQAPDQWGEKLVRFFDEFEVGMDAVWYGKEIDLDEVDSYYFMSGYEVLSLFPSFPLWEPAGPTCPGDSSKSSEPKKVSQVSRIFTRPAAASVMPCLTRVI
jgi:hypothetical protein